MATIADAMMITLGIDTSALVKGQKQAEAAMEKTKDTAVKAGKAVEKSAQGMTEGLSKASSAFLELTALFLGGRGFKELVENSMRANTAIGNLGTSIGSSSEFVTAWSIAAQRMGGSASSTMSSLQSLSDKLTSLRIEGNNLPDALWQLQGRSKVPIDFLHGVDALGISLAKAGEAMAKIDPVGANYLMRQLTDPATAALLIKQGAGMAAYLESLKRLAPDDKDIAASNALTKSWATLGAQFDQLYTKISTALAPWLEKLAEKIGVLVEAVSKFVAENPGWTTAIASVLALLGGGAMVTAIASVAGLTSALLGLAGISLTGILSVLSALGVSAAGIAWLSGAFSDDAQAKPEVGPGGGATSGRSGIGLRGAADMPAGSSAGNLTKLIEDESARVGIPPSIMQGVRAGESRHKGFYDFGDKNDGGAWGPFQFNMGKGRFGDQFMRDTGLDPRDPHTIPAQTRYMAEFLARKLKENPNYAAGGKSSPLHAIWHGYSGPTNADPKWGDSGYAPSPPSVWTGMPTVGGLVGLRAGAAHAAALNNISNNHSATTSSSSNKMHVGAVNVNAPGATDARGIADHISDALASSMFANFANYGPN